MKISVLDWATVSCTGDIPLDKINELGTVDIFPLTKPEETAVNIGSAEAVFCNKVVFRQQEGGVFRQADVRSGDGEFPVGGHGVVGAGHIVEHQVLVTVCVVAQPGPDQAGVL